MAILVLTDVRLELNSVNLSTLLRSITVNAEVDDQDATAMGGSGWKAIVGGIKNWEVECEVNQDFAASQVDATIWPLLGTLIPVKARPTTAAISSTNPEWQGNALVKQYSPLDGKVGDLAVVKFKWPGSGALTRATT